MDLISRENVPQVSLLIHQASQAKSVVEYTEGLAKNLLCQKKSISCGSCRSCLLMSESSHPDFFWLGASGSIKIDEVRSVLSQIARTCQLGQGQVVVLEVADSLTTQAANALLKNLEEPKQGLWFVLLSSVESRVLATIRSRCVIRQWHKGLSQAQDDPGELMDLLLLIQNHWHQLSHQPVSFSSSLKSYPMDQILSAFQWIVSSILSIKTGLFLPSGYVKTTTLNASAGGESEIDCVTIDQLFMCMAVLDRFAGFAQSKIVKTANYAVDQLCIELSACLV